MAIYSWILEHSDIIGLIIDFIALVVSVILTVVIYKLERRHEKEHEAAEEKAQKAAFCNCCKIKAQKKTLPQYYYPIYTLL